MLNYLCLYAKDHRVMNESIEICRLMIVKTTTKVICYILTEKYIQNTYIIFSNSMTCQPKFSLFAYL